MAVGGGQTNSVQRDPWLDVVRGIAITGVVAVHSIQTSGKLVTKFGGTPNENVAYVISLGRYGVELFFVLSGWLLASIYGVGTGVTFKARSYWVRRATRIYPLWLLFIFLEVCRGVLFPSRSSAWTSARTVSLGDSEILHSPIVVIIIAVSFSSWAFAVGIVSGATSIEQEVFHYALFPFIRKVGFSNAVRGLVVVNLLTTLLSLSRNSFDDVNVLCNMINAYFRLGLVSSFQFFLLGVIAHKIFTENRLGNFSKIRDTTRTNAPMLIALLITFVLVPMNSGPNAEALGFVVLAISASRIILDIRYLREIIAVLGRYSYFIFFCHFKVLEIVEFLFGNLGDRYQNLGRILPMQLMYFVTICAAALFGSLLLAVPSNKFIERPILRFGRRF